MVTAKMNPNGWYPETWASTLEAEMEVVIQMEHCGMVTLERILYLHAGLGRYLNRNKAAYLARASPIAM